LAQHYGGSALSVVSVTDNPPPDAFQKLWTPLLKFNEHAAGNANACTLAILLREPTTDELRGGLWARSLWGSLYGG